VDNVPGRHAEGDAEIDLLLACVQPGAGREDSHLERLLQRDLNWERVVRLALAHGVGPLFAHRLGRLQPGNLPDDIRGALALYLQGNRERNLQLTRALLQILDALKERNVAALPFKGQVLGAMAYGDFSLRRAGDLDLLVRKRDLATVCQVLDVLGYREKAEFEIGRPMNAAEQAGYLRYQCEYAFFRSDDKILVEPHWAIVPTTFAADLECDEFWARAETVRLGDRHTPTLAAEDLLVVLCVHSAKHEWTLLQWICDVASLLESRPALDLDAILAHARARGLERMLLLGLGLAQRMFATSLPPPVQQRLNSDAAAAALVEVLVSRLFTPGLETSPVWEISRLRLAMRERLRDRAAYLFRTVVTPTEKHLRLVALPDAVHGLYVPLKLVHDYVALPVWHLARRMTGDPAERP
jgi:hypothetical protein